MTEQTAVIVPVMRRPQNAAPFMESLRATTDDAVVYPVCDDSDYPTIEAWEEAGAEPVIRIPRPDRDGTFAEKVNFAAALTYEPWLFITGDDVRFHPGWLEHARAAAGDRYDVIGTNDLANPRVMAGQHGTHLLIRRSYVDEQGASWDGPGVVCHEGYRHWYVDDEVVTAARQRGAWASARASVVEHLHPLFGKGTNDDVYRLGQSHAAQDGALFQRRAAQYAH